MSQKFRSIFVTWVKICMILLWDLQVIQKVTQWILLNFFEPQYTLFYVYKALPDHWGTYNQKEISSILKLPYYD